MDKSAFTIATVSSFLALRIRREFHVKYNPRPRVRDVGKTSEAGEAAARAQADVQFTPDWVKSSTERLHQLHWKLEDRAYVFVNSKPQLVRALDDLSQHDVWALDMEFHNYHSLTGFACLIQISTSSTDFIVDVLAHDVRHELQQGSRFRELLRDTSRLVVAHGCMNDIAWLHTNFDCHITRLLDTAEIARVLKYKAVNYGALVQAELEIELDKSFSTADWSKRPLHSDLIRYARHDTAYMVPVALSLMHKVCSLLEKDASRAAGMAERLFKKCAGLAGQRSAVVIKSKFSASNMAKQFLNDVAKLAAKKSGQPQQTTAQTPKSKSKTASAESVTSKVTPSKATPCKDTESKDRANKATPSKDTESKDTASKATPSKATSSKATSSKATSSKATPSKATPSKATPSKATPSKDTASKATPSKATPSKATPSKATPSKRSGKSWGGKARGGGGNKHRNTLPSYCIWSHRPAAEAEMGGSSGSLHQSAAASQARAAVEVLPRRAYFLSRQPTAVHRQGVSQAFVTVLEAMASIRHGLCAKHDESLYAMCPDPLLLRLAYDVTATLLRVRHLVYECYECQHPRPSKLAPHIDHCHRMVHIVRKTWHKPRASKLFNRPELQPTLGAWIHEVCVRHAQQWTRTGKASTSTAGNASSDGGVAAEPSLAVEGVASGSLVVDGTVVLQVAETQFDLRQALVEVGCDVDAPGSTIIKRSRTAGNRSGVSGVSGVSGSGGGGGDEGVGAEDAKLERAKKQSLQRPLYRNVEMLSPAGTVLAKIDHKKARWYEERGLAEVVHDEAAGATRVMLNFTPKGAGHAGDAFHLAAKVNQCVVCGSQDSLKRMYIVPRMFRRLFPVGAKCHTSHDVVLLCAPCHMAADRAQSALVKRTVDCLPMMRARAAKKEGDSGSGPPRSFDETLDAARDSPSVTSLVALFGTLKRTAKPLLLPPGRLTMERSEELESLLQAGCQYMFDEWSDLFQEALQLPLPVVHRAVQWYGQDSVGGQQSAPPTELLESLADLKVDTKLRDKIVEAFTEQGISPQTAAHPTDVVHVAYKEVLRGALVLDMAGEPSLRDSLPSQQPQDNAVLPDTQLTASQEAHLTAFVQAWRQHFISRNAPQHLQAGWSVDYTVITRSTAENPLKALHTTAQPGLE